MIGLGEIKKVLQEFGLEWFNVYYSTYRGFVESNEDPEKLNRLKLRVPQVYGNRVKDYWAWPVGIYAGNNSGAVFLPKPNDMVWVRFENGNPDYPIWEYGHWNDKAKSPTNNTLQTESGLSILFNDKAKKLELGLVDSQKQPASLGDSNKELLDKIIESIESVNKALNEYATTEAAATSSVPILSPLTPAYSKLIADSATALVELQKLKAETEKVKAKDIKIS